MIGDDVLELQAAKLWHMYLRLPPALQLILGVVNILPSLYGMSLTERDAPSSLSLEEFSGSVQAKLFASGGVETGTTGRSVFIPTLSHSICFFLSP